MTKEPILINHDTIALVQLFKRTAEFDNAYDPIYSTDYLTEEGMTEEYYIDSEAGKRYIDALEDRWNIIFLNSVVKECIRLIKEQAELYNPDFLNDLKEIVKKELNI